MSSFEDLQAALALANDKVSSVKADTEFLLKTISDLQANPPTGMTPGQQASLDAAVSTAQNIATSLGALDDTVNPPAEPAPVDATPAPVEGEPAAADTPAPEQPAA